MADKISLPPLPTEKLDLNGMCGAFHRLIEAHASSFGPFHNPINTDAQIALRELRGIVTKLHARDVEVFAAKDKEISRLRAELKKITNKYNLLLQCSYYHDDRAQAPGN